MATITVNPGGSIQDAINDAVAGDIILVASGVYNENITIDKAITLQGSNQGIAPDKPDIDPAGGIDVNQGYRQNEEAWIKGTVTVASNDVTIDGFRLRNENGTVRWEGAPNNFRLVNNYVTGYNAANAPTFGNANSNNPTNVVTGWELSSNYIGGLTDGTGGSMNLAGLSGSTISNNTFWRPRAAHIYLASLTDVTIQGNTFFHGLHGAGFNQDGLGQYFSGATYGGGRNYWFELKGTNNEVDILNNTGEFNSGGIQLYSEPNQASPFVFNGITIAGNSFPRTNFINPYTEAPTDGLSGLIPAVMATAAVGGASGSNLTIRNNTVTLDLGEVKFATDHKSSLEVRGNFDGVTVANNSVTPTGANTSADVDILTGLNLYGGLSGQVSVEGNQFLGIGGNPEDDDYYGIDFIPTFANYGTFAGDDLDILGNTITNWENGATLRLVNPGPNVSGSINVRDNILSGNERNVFDEIPPTISTTSISFPEGQTDETAVLGTVSAADNLANTNNVGVVSYSIDDPNGFFEIDSTGQISLTAAGLSSAANNFDITPNRFTLDVTVTDGGDITTTDALDIFVTDVEGREEVDASDFPPGEIIVPRTPETATVFVDDLIGRTFSPSTAPDIFNLEGGSDVIQGILAQFNSDIIRNFIPEATIRITAITFTADQIIVTFGSAILDIDANNDGNSDATITLEGDFTDALFLVNPDGTANATDINYDILSSRINRFQNKDVPGTYLFAGEEESITIRDAFPQFEEEGYAFKVTTVENDNLMRMNRFQNKDLPGTYLFANEEESQSIRANFPQFEEEGIAFYAAAPGSSTGELIYRFQNTSQPGTYIFVGEAERDSIIANFPQFALEGEAFEIVV